MKSYLGFTKSILEFTKSILEATGKLVFPPKCIFCSKLLGPEVQMEMCKECFNRIPFIVDYGAFIEKFLYDTDTLSTWFDGVFCICEYKGIIKQSIMRYKYFGKAHYYRTFAMIIADKLKEMINISEFDIIISVPLHKQRERKRGYNQSLLISKEISKIMGIPDKSSLLIRHRYTDTQSLLHKNERYLNVKNSFRVTNENEISGKSILLVDDVLTTGYTINECSRMLKESGAEKVYAVVIAAALHI